MFNHIFFFCFSITTYEFLRYVKFFYIIKLNLKIYKRIIRLIKLKNISDFQKEKMLLYYSKTLFFLSGKLILILTTILIFFLFFNQLSDSILDLFLSSNGIFEFTLIILLYHLIRTNNGKLY